MVQCFVPDCNHQSEAKDCSFFRFPRDVKEQKRWEKLIRRADKGPTSSSRVCSCHFRNGDKTNGPTIFKRNALKLFPGEEKNKKTKLRAVKDTSNNDELQMQRAQQPENTEVHGELGVPQRGQGSDQPISGGSNVVLQIELETVRRELEDLKLQNKYQRERYSVANLSDAVIRMETGLPNRQIFEIVVGYVRRFEGSISYYLGWKVDCLKLEDQVFLTLMKVRQNYTNLHLSQLFNCSCVTVRNIIVTFVHVLYTLLYEDCMQGVPSKEKNAASLPGSFVFYGNCRMVIDCTDIEVATPSNMAEQKQTYSSYRGMNSFKVLIGVAPNAAITYVSPLYPGSTSDKVIVQKSGVLSHFVAGDLILADKGFLIQDIVPQGVSVNIPPFLDNTKFSEREIKITKKIAKCRIHVERANARLKDFKILSWIPARLRGHAETLLKLCAALVNLQGPLIKEVAGTLDVDNA